MRVLTSIDPPAAAAAAAATSTFTSGEGEGEGASVPGVNDGTGKAKEAPPPPSSSSQSSSSPPPAPAAHAGVVAEPFSYRHMTARDIQPMSTGAESEAKVAAIDKFHKVRLVLLFLFEGHAKAGGGNWVGDALGG